MFKNYKTQNFKKHSKSIEISIKFIENCYRMIKLRLKKI